MSLEIINGCVVLEDAGANGFAQRRVVFRCTCGESFTDTVHNVQRNTGSKGCACSSRVHRVRKKRNRKEIFSEYNYRLSRVWERAYGIVKPPVESILRHDFKSAEDYFDALEAEQTLKRIRNV